LLFSALIVVSACGKKGPPLPPLLKVPVAPTELVADRHGNVVDIQLRVPTANTDGTKPANIERVDVYGFTGPEVLDNDQVLKFATKVGSVPVKAPADPNQTIDEDEAEDPELTGSGLDQGAYAHLTEHVTPQIETPVVVPRHDRAPKGSGENADGPLAPTILSVPSRTYLGVGVSTKGKPGRFSERVRIALIEPPPALEPPKIGYDEKTITLEWTPLPSVVAGAPMLPARGGVLPSTPIGMMIPEITYHVYEVAEGSDGTPSKLMRLTATPVSEPRFQDPRIEWGERRCYAVRALVIVDGAGLEGEESPPQCVTPTDTFPPVAPVGVQAIPSDGAISLIWDANTDKDIGGYYVLRGLAPGDTLERLTPEPIPQTSFQDRVKPGVRFVYAVQAVDTAGNVSPMSAKIQETAR
jgi:hypothetical protein